MVQCSDEAFAMELDATIATPATVTPTTLADAAATDVDVAAVSCKASDSFKIESLSPPPAILQPLKYPPMHIFVSH